MSQVALTMTAVSVRYGGLWAVRGVSLEVRRGEIFGLLGANGSGKSSTLGVAAGTLEPAAGEVRVCGLSRRRHPREYAGLVGLVPQEMAVYEELSVRDNLHFFGRLYGLGGRALAGRADEALALTGLEHLASRPVRSLSGGMQRRVNLACALLHDPPLLLLDEPTVAIDTAARADLLANLGRLRERGHAVVLTTHHLEDAREWCDRVGVLERGHLVAYGPTAEFLRGPAGCALVARLREPLDGCRERALRDRLGPGVSMSVAGRSLTLEAADAELLGQALADLLTCGVPLESYRTPEPGLERFFADRAAPDWSVGYPS